MLTAKQIPLPPTFVVVHMMQGDACYELSDGRYALEAGDGEPIVIVDPVNPAETHPKMHTTVESFLRCSHADCDC